MNTRTQKKIISPEKRASLSHPPAGKSLLRRAKPAIFIGSVEDTSRCVWVFDSYTGFPFSFTNVCTELGLSPDHIRKQLRDCDTQASEGGRPKMIRRPAIRTLKVKGEPRRSRRS